jgi:hypothetical protein
MSREVPAARRRQVEKRIGQAWTSCGRPADGFFDRRGASARLAAVLREEAALGVGSEASRKALEAEGAVRALGVSNRWPI